MKRDLFVVFLCFAAGLTGANTQPILVGGLGKLLFPETSPSANLSASGGALTIAAGGTNKNIALNPSGTGTVSIAGTSDASLTTRLQFPNNGSIQAYDSAGTSRLLMYLGNENPDILHIRNSQRGAGGPIQFEGAGGTVKASIDTSGNVNATGVFEKNGTPGVGIGSTINVCTGSTCTGAQTCSLIFSGGIRIGGTCP